MARKQVDENDAALWQKVADTVTPLPRRSFVKSASPEKPQNKLNQKASKKRQQKTGPTARQIDQVAHITPSAARLQPADLNTIGYGGISRSNARMIRTGQARPRHGLICTDRPVMKRNQSLSVSLSLLPVKVTVSFLLSPARGCRVRGDPAQSAVLAVLAAIGRAGDRLLSGATKRWRQRGVLRQSETVMTPFGIKLREYRQQKGLTLAVMSRRLGVTEAYISQLENGRKGQPRLCWLIRSVLSSG